jgi:hypothetical protein
MTLLVIDKYLVLTFEKNRKETHAITFWYLQNNSVVTKTDYYPIMDFSQGNRSPIMLSG